jgi:uncharacterized protein DUF4199
MKTGVKWGLMLGASVVVWTLVIHALGFYTTNLAAGQKADVIATILPIAAILLALRERGRLAAGSLSIKESVVTALAVGVVSVPVTAGFLWWYHHYMNPRWLDLLVDYQHAKMAAAGAAADEIARAEAQQRSSGTDAAQLTGALVGSILVSGVIGLIGALLIRWRNAKARSA